MNVLFTAHLVHQTHIFTLIFDPEATVTRPQRILP